MPLKFYDIETDTMREPTQIDIDLMQAGVQAYGRLRRAVEQVQAELLEDIKEAKMRGSGVLQENLPDSGGHEDAGL